MGCLTLDITTQERASLSVVPEGAVSLFVGTQDRLSLAVQALGGAVVMVAAQGRLSLDVAAEGGAVLSVGKVCATGGDTMVVLAASDGALRTPDGGYFLLNPATNRQ